LIGIALVGAFLFVGDRWGWWFAVGLLAAGGVLLVVVLVVVLVALDIRRVRKRPRPEHHALADVSSWVDDGHVEVLLAELMPQERVLVALPSTRPGGGGRGVLALTDLHLRFCSALRGPGLSIRRDDIEAAAVEEHSDHADIRLLVAGEETRFSMIGPKKRAWEMLGLLLAEMDDMGDPADAAESRVAAPEADPPTVHAHEANIVLSRSARSRAARAGGNAYVWATPLGTMMRVHASTTKPEGVRFETVHEVRGISVHIEDDALAANTLAIRCRPWWPGSPLTVDTGITLGE
jgi:hypothetical protein